MTNHLTPKAYLAQAKSIADRIDNHVYAVIKIAHNAGELSGSLDDCANAGRLAASAAVAMFEKIVGEYLLNVLEGDYEDAK